MTCFFIAGVQSLAQTLNDEETANQNCKKCYFEVEVEEVENENEIENSSTAVTLLDENGDIDFAAVEAQWAKVQKFKNLDKEFFGPANFSEVPSLTEIRKEFGIPYLTLAAWSDKAALEFYKDAGEGVDSDEAFLPILELLVSEKIKKSFFLYGSGEGYNLKYLLVVDDQMRAFGFKIGYSE